MEIYIEDNQYFVETKKDGEIIPFCLDRASKCTLESTIGLFNNS